MKEPDSRGSVGKTGVCFAPLGEGGREGGELCSSIWRCGCRNEAANDLTAPAFPARLCWGLLVRKTAGTDG